MTHPQFWKFKIDQDIFKWITAIPSDQINTQLYNVCDDSVQNNINNVTDGFEQDESSRLQVVETIVIKPSNPTVCAISVLGILPKHPSNPSKLILSD